MCPSEVSGLMTIQFGLQPNYSVWSDCTRSLTTLVNLFTPVIASRTVLHGLHALLAVARPVHTALPRAERHVRPNWLNKATPLSMLLLSFGLYILDDCKPRLARDVTVCVSTANQLNLLQTLRIPVRIHYFRVQIIRKRQVRGHRSTR